MLVVIDVQQSFVNKLSPCQRQPLIQRITWLMDVAQRLDIPIVVTAEDMTNLGGSCSEVIDHLPDSVVQIDKMVFGLAGDANALKAIKSTQRNTAILVGLETDVCVCQSALGLSELGYKVAVVQDAVCSPGPAHDYGIDRLRSSEVILTSSKGIYYEWLRTVDNAAQFDRRFKSELSIPEDLIL